MRTLKRFGNFFGLSPCDLALNCSDVSDVALLLARVSPVSFDISQCELECAYYQRILRGLPVEYKDVLARKASAKRKHNMKLSPEEESILEYAEMGFIGNSIWSDGITSHEYITRNDEVINLIQSLMDVSGVIYDLGSSTGMSQQHNISDSQALVTKLLKCTDKQLPYLLSQELSRIVSEYDTRAKIKLFSEDVTELILNIGDNVSVEVSNNDWELITDLELSKSEFSYWNKLREYIKTSGYDRLDSGAIAKALAQMFRCALLSDRAYSYDVASELEKCGFFFLRGNAIESLLDNIKLVVFEQPSVTLTATKAGYDSLIHAWITARMLLEEIYTEVGEEF